MAHPPVRRAHHHIFNFQHTTQQSPFIRATFTVKGTTFSDTAMLDSGCSTCIIPISQLLEDAKKHITNSDTLVKGINGSITTRGKLNCDITIGDRNSPAFKEVNILDPPNHPNRDELENVTDLLLRYIDILGTENGEKGTFIKPDRIPTNGQSRSQRQHPVAQALEADVNDEIDYMAAEGIIETCHDPKGFNSPVFAVCKKNGTI